MKNRQFVPNLQQPATYEIKVAGHLDPGLADWVAGMTMTVNNSADGLSITTLTCTVDQAALIGLLRRLYGLGIPLISVNFVV
ncbi:MAG: hypothetical protein H6672_02400 [Anaerolineaceae bacterium]|nr:hypothetical protein [Anaerolineaceae bacterium]